MPTAAELDLAMRAQAPLEEMPRAVPTRADENRAVVPMTRSEAFYAMIERAARDPSVDVAKMERLFEMQEKQRARDAEMAFNAAMTEAQMEMRPIAADAANSQTRSKYASYLALDKALRPIYTKHGFALSFDTGDTPLPDHVRVLCYASHNNGHSRTYKIDMPADGKGAKGGDVMTKTHAVGSAATYGQRYLLKGIFNIAVGEDDDGNSADGNDPITNDEVDKIKELLKRDDMDVEKFCSFMRVEYIGQIKQSDYRKAITAINEASLAKAAKKKAAAK